MSVDLEEPVLETKTVNSDVAETQKEKNKENKSHDDVTHNQPQHHENNHQKNIIIIKRIKKQAHKHHGGAWKIAYADFVTAMMTFFLLLWLLSMLNKYQLEGISEYFKDPSKKPTKQSMDSKMDKVAIGETTTSSKLTPPKTAANREEIEKEMKEKEKSRAASEKIKQELQDKLKSDPKLSQYENSLNFQVLSQGLKIELKDIENKTMFTSGKADFAKYAEPLLKWLGEAMNKYPNRVMIIGHTDSKKYAGQLDYSNWELSSDRANSTRRELIKHGMMPEKIVRIVGVADTDKLETTKSGEDPQNRRIAIIILTDQAYKQMQME